MKSPERTASRAEKHRRCVWIVALCAAAALANCKRGTASPSASSPQSPIVRDAAGAQVSATPSAAPAPVPPIRDEVVQVRNGGTHVCILLASGTVRCWGRNMEGQCGQPTTMETVPPATTVAGISEVRELITLPMMTIVVRRDGSVWFWGIGLLIQDGGESPIHVPRPFAALTNVTRLAAIQSNACARIGDGTVQCWGSNRDGQVGNGSTRPVPVPTAVPGLTDVAEVRLGEEHACARLTSGIVQCWGGNEEGQLGDGTTVSHRVPRPVHGVVGATALVSEGLRNCAQVADGSWKCWGSSGWDTGQISDRRTTAIVSPGLASLSTVSLGMYHICGLVPNGDVRCLASFGGPERQPYVVPGLANVRLLDSREALMCAVTNDGSVYCRGDHSNIMVPGGAENGSPDLVRIPMR